MSIIVLEGPDGAGKTTTVEALARALGYAIVKTPTAEYRARRDPYDDPAMPTRKRFDFYADGLAASVHEIMSQAPRGVIVDRYTHSLEIYHSEMDPTIDYASLVRQRDYPFMTHTIVLTADMDVLRRRIFERADQHDTKLEKNFDLIERVNNRFRNLHGVMHIDTGRTPLPTVVQRAVKYAQYALAS